ncbi:MAG: complex I NDUFA9 subunit family protein [Paracoccaceae bacterium]
MSKLVTIFGGSGFVGRYIARRMAKQGWRVRVATRRPNEAIFVKPYGTVGQVEPVFCNVRDDASVSAAMQGADVVVNCTGILIEKGRNSFDTIYDEAATRIARISAELGVERLVHFSAIGADVDSSCKYFKTKGLGEAGVLEHFGKAIILRPSIIFGTEDNFFNKFARMTRWTLMLPVVGADTILQPVYVDDVAAAAEKAIIGEAKHGVYELGGPDVESLRALMQRMLVEIERRRLVLNMPFGVGSIVGRMFDIFQSISLGLFTNTILTRDQVAMLRVDNVVSKRARGLSKLGIKPSTMESVLPDYLWPYRPAGQFAAIKDSAENLKA